MPQRAEANSMVVRVYGLFEAEFVHILGTFPLVDEGTKQAALAAFQTILENPS